MGIALSAKSSKATGDVRPPYPDHDSVSGTIDSEQERTESSIYCDRSDIIWKDLDKEEKGCCFKCWYCCKLTDDATARLID